MMTYCCHNGDFLDEQSRLFTHHNRAFKYGDGFFETMKIVDGNIQLSQLHEERAALTMKMLRMQLPAGFDLKKVFTHMVQLANMNECRHMGRLRLQFFRSDDNACEFFGEAVQLVTSECLPITLNLYVHHRRSCDAFSNLKSCNFLPYVMAAMEAKDKGVDDCLLLNSEGNICDSSKANVFLILKDKVVTPALHQGCVNGVMRRFVIDTLKSRGIPVYQQEVSEADVLAADEVFLTNAIIGIQPVRKYKDKEYNCMRSFAYRQSITPAMD